LIPERAELVISSRLAFSIRLILLGDKDNIVKTINDVQKEVQQDINYQGFDFNNNRFMLTKLIDICIDHIQKESL
jgi:hypothetical protein